MEIKPGFLDTGSVTGDTKMAFTTYTPPPLKKKVVRHQHEEQEKATLAEQKLAAAREKLAAKQEANARAHGGAVNTSSPRKHTKIRREKVRYGQAPRNALPNGTTEVATGVPSLGAAPGDPSKSLGEAPGALIGGPTQSVTTISTGTGGEEQGDPLGASRVQPDHKTRFSARPIEGNDKKAEVQLARAEKNVSKRPVAATNEESVDEKVQAAPLGLANDAKKTKKQKRAKNEPKERFQEKVKPVQTQPTVDPTVNPALGTSATGTAGTQGAKSADQTTLPPATPTPPNPAATGQPIPSVTSASPSTPNTATPQPQ